MTPTQSVKAFPLFCALAVFIAGTIFLLGCNSAVMAPFGAINYATSDDKSEERNGDKKEKEEDLLKEMERPTFAFFITGRQNGYIEPCGCTGLYNQKGGLMRRHRVQQLLSDRGWDLIPMDAGNQIRRFGQQPTTKLRHTYQGLCNVMKYEAIGFGPGDLKTSPVDLLQVMCDVADSDVFVCANIDVLGQGLQKQAIIIERAGKKIGVTQAMDDEHVAMFKDNDEIETKSLNEGLNAATNVIADCDLKVLMLRTDKVDTAKRVAQDFPVFDLIVHTTSAGEPEKLPTQVRSENHTTSMIQIGTKGMYVGIVGCYDRGGKLEMKYERVPLDGRFTDSKAIEQIFESYQNELKLLYTGGKLADIKPRPHPSGNKYVGSQVCFDCHDEEYEIWEDGVDGDGGPHFVATDDIVNPPNHRGHIARHYDPECISCHAVGWDPQGMYPYESGFISLKQHAHLTQNGCENCHGPGSAHVSLRRAMDKGKKFSAKELDDDLLSVRLTLKEAENEHCGQCHDADNSPDFLKDGAFKKYWAQIEH